MRVLLATDGSEDARTACVWLAQFPLPADSRLRVVTAVSIPSSALDLPTVRDFLGSLREETRWTAEARERSWLPASPSPKRGCSKATPGR
jgi:hypothetical protein